MTMNNVLGKTKLNHDHVYETHLHKNINVSLRIKIIKILYLNELKATSFHNVKSERQYSSELIFFALHKFPN